MVPIIADSGKMHLQHTRQHSQGGRRAKPHKFPPSTWHLHKIEIYELLPVPCRCSKLTSKCPARTLYSSILREPLTSLVKLGMTRVVFAPHDLLVFPLNKLGVSKFPFLYKACCLSVPLHNKHSNPLTSQLQVNDDNGIHFTRKD